MHAFFLLFCLTVFPLSIGMYVLCSCVCVLVFDFFCLVLFPFVWGVCLCSFHRISLSIPLLSTPWPLPHNICHLLHAAPHRKSLMQIPPFLPSPHHRQRYPIILTCLPSLFLYCAYPLLSSTRHRGHSLHCCQPNLQPHDLPRQRDSAPPPLSTY